MRFTFFSSSSCYTWLYSIVTKTNKFLVHFLLFCFPFLSIQSQAKMKDWDSFFFLLIFLQLYCICCTLNKVLMLGRRFWPLLFALDFLLLRIACKKEINEILYLTSARLLVLCFFLYFKSSWLGYNVNLVTI